MTTKITTAITMALTLIVIVPARAEIASKAYVDERNNTLIFGTTEPDSEMVQSLAEVGGVTGIMVPNRLSEDNAILVTDGYGNVSMAKGGYLVNDNISYSANIELGKLAMPIPGDDCETNGCMLMYYNGKYVWEVITRDTNETIETDGYVNSTVPVAEDPSIIPVRRCSSNSDCLDGERCFEGTCRQYMA